VRFSAREAEGQPTAPIYLRSAQEVGQGSGERIGKDRPKAVKTVDRCPIPRLPSPSRHIYNPLTIAIAFRRLLAFDRAWQLPIKVDGTFA
jgi:hypothetical protein